jgi:hypothetical protein
LCSCWLVIRFLVRNRFGPGFVSFFSHVADPARPTRPPRMGGHGHREANRGIGPARAPKRQAGGAKSLRGCAISCSTQQRLWLS